MIPLLISYTVALIAAYISAKDDAKQIDENEKVMHALQWLVRALVVGGVLVFCVALFDLPWYKVPIIGVSCGFLFSAAFRTMLNGMRGLDWRYVSPSSWYDTLFIRLMYHDRELTLQEYHELLYEKAKGRVSIYTDAVHRAGLLAYAFELLMFAGLTYLSLRVK